MTTAGVVTVIHIEANIGFIVSILFPIVTSFFWPWHESWWGWNTILLELSIAGTILPSVLSADFHLNSTPLQAVRLIALATVAINVLWRTVMIWRTQRAGASRRVSRKSEAGQPEGAARPEEVEGV
jgi:hypothetical protein